MLFFAAFGIFCKKMFAIRKNVGIFAESNMMGALCTFVTCTHIYWIWRLFINFLFIN